MAKAYGADVQELRYAWGETPQPEDLRTRLEETGAEVVFLVHSETSTGVVADVQALAAAAREAGALSVVDAVSSLGAVPLETDAWGLDVVVAGSQKALMTPPGLSLTTVSPAGWERSARTTTPRFYFDWARMQAQLEAGLDAVHARRLARRSARRGAGACCSRRVSRRRSRGTPRSAAPAARA